MTRGMRSILAMLLVALAGCAFDGSGVALPDDPDDPTPPTDPLAPDAGSDPLAEPDAAPTPSVVVCTVREEHVGIDGLIVKVGDQFITFEAWIPRDGDPTRFLGFELSTQADGRRYDIELREERLRGEGTSWVYPGGTDSNEAIRRVDFCDDDGGGPGDDD